MAQICQLSSRLARQMPAQLLRTRTAGPRQRYIINLGPPRRRLKSQDEIGRSHLLVCNVPTQKKMNFATSRDNPDLKHSGLHNKSCLAQERFENVGNPNLRIFVCFSYKKEFILHSVALKSLNTF